MTRRRISVLIGVTVVAAAGLGIGIGIAASSSPGAPASTALQPRRPAARAMTTTAP